MNLLDLQLIGPRVLVKRLAEAKLQSSLIEVVQDEARPSTFALVLGVGTGVREDIQVGDEAITKPFCGAPCEIEIESTTVEAFIVMESDVLAVDR
jgi:co-chaperonin GroES (HSP10)